MSILSSLRRLLPASLKVPLRRAVWKQLGLQAQLRSGLHVELACHADWIIYHEIFGAGEYDLPIRETLAEHTANQPLVACDLGANVGYFTLRLADSYWLKNGAFTGLDITQIEGAPSVFGELKKRMNAQGELQRHVSTFNRLVGERTGQGIIHESNAHFAGTTAASSKGGGQAIEYFDLVAHFSQHSEIHLLKCDVEGAEVPFLRAHRELLPKVRRAVIEFHGWSGGDAEGRDIMRQAGFVRQNVMRDEGGFQVVYFSRDK